MSPSCDGECDKSAYHDGVMAGCHCDRWDIDEGNCGATRPDNKVSAPEPVSGRHCRVHKEQPEAKLFRKSMRRMIAIPRMGKYLLNELSLISDVRNILR